MTSMDSPSAPVRMQAADWLELQGLLTRIEPCWQVLDMAAATPGMRDEVMKVAVVLRGVQGGLSGPPPSGVAPRGS